MFEFYFGLIAFTVIVLYLFACAEKDKPHWLKLLLLPLVLLVAAMVPAVIEEAKGHPTIGVPTGEVEYIAHREKSKDHIVVWLLEEEKDRLYLIPNTKESRDNLRKGQEKRTEGRQQRVRFSDQNNLELVQETAMTTEEAEAKDGG